MSRRGEGRFEEERRLYDEVRSAMDALSDDLSTEVLEKLDRRVVTPEALRAMVREEVRSALEDARRREAGDASGGRGRTRRGGGGSGRDLGPGHLFLAVCLGALLVVAGWVGWRMLQGPAAANGETGRAAVPTEARPTPTSRPEAFPTTGAETGNGSAEAETAPGAEEENGAAEAATAPGAEAEAGAADDPASSPSDTASGGAPDPDPRGGADPAPPEALR